MKKKNEYIPALSFDSLTFLYDPVVRWTTREETFKTALVRQATLKTEQKVLDLGCGTATLTIALKKSYSGAFVHGLDGDSKILSIARRKIQYENVEIFLEQGFSDSLPYKNDTFDCVVSSLFFHHLTTEKKQKTLSELFRVIKSGGFLHVADWGKPSNFLMKIASIPVQWLDGATTKDSFQGSLPKLIKNAGFIKIVETGSYDTFFGTIRLHQAQKK
jgi:ubiquinone/menaquinone biosynthesis C-methylase UbiE